MSWKKAETGLRGLIRLMVFIVAFSSASEAFALGPFAHLQYAKKIWPLMARTHNLSAADHDLERAFLAGALAPDAGYYLGRKNGLAQVAHQASPWLFVKNILADARTHREKAFALGWASHAWLDTQGHQRLVNQAAGGAYSKDPLLHKQIEWGLDCWLLEQTDGDWLWDVEPDLLAGLIHWQRGLFITYGKNVPISLLKDAVRAQYKEIVRLPRVWWLSGRLKRPESTLVNGVGWALGNTLRPLYVKWLIHDKGDVDILAVLTPLQPKTREIEVWKVLLRNASRENLQVTGNQMNLAGNLDIDPLCDDESCPEARQAREWLAGLD